MEKDLQNSNMDVAKIALIVPFGDEAEPAPPRQNGSSRNLRCLRQYALLTWLSAANESRKNQIAITTT